MWARVSIDGHIKLYFISNRYYQNVFCFPICKSYGRFMDDNVRPDQENIVKNSFKEVGVDRMVRLANSPNSNIIEND